MVNNIFALMHYGTIMLFGIYLSSAFLGIRMSKKNIFILLGFSAVAGAVNAVCFVLFGVDFTERIYPLIIHLPLILFLRFFYKYRIISVVMSVLAAYLCCQISNWMGLLFLSITGLDLVYYVVRIVTTIIVFVLLMFFVSNAMAQLLQKPAKDILILGLMPFVYYLYDYAVTVYTLLFYAGIEVINEFLGFMLCIFYVLFLLIYFNEYEKKRETEQRNQLMEMKRIQSEKEIEMMKRSEYAIQIMRHDMRHYLNDIVGFIKSGENDRAQAYISEIIAIADKTATKRYCSNKIVDMILTSYEDRIREQEINFQYSIRIPEELSFSDSDISSILSNALENAVHAASLSEKGKRKIEMDLRVKNDTLLISVKNTYVGKIELADGIPLSKTAGHGFGTQSIRYVVEKLKGNCQFVVDDEFFILRIVL